MADGSHFVKHFQKNKVAYPFQMARNAIESEFRTYKMADGSHYVISGHFRSIRNLKLHNYRSEIARNTIKGDFGNHFVKK